MSRVIDTSVIVPLIASLVQKACYELDEAYLDAVRSAQNNEASPYGKEILRLILENAALAKYEKLPVCQDTGTCIVFMEIGQEVSWSGQTLFDAVNEGVHKGYIEGFLRPSIVRDPFMRVNTGDNTPAVLHTEICAGSTVRITVMPKGGGCENVGSYATLLPQAGRDGFIDFVLNTVENAGGKCCPPVTVGIGLGGSMDSSCLLAKKALLRPIGESNPDAYYAELEMVLLEKINATGIGPLGMGGRTTALAVHIMPSPCHITALPVALCFQCHAARYKSVCL